MKLKRLVSAALAVSMAVSMMPATAVSAFAEETSTNTAVTTTTVDENAPTYGDCGVEGHEKEVKWAFNKETGVLNISGTGRMADYKYSDTEDTRPWAAFANVIKEVKIEEGVTGIGGNAFRNLTALTKTNIPASINYLGDYIYAQIVNLRMLNGHPILRHLALRITIRMLERILVHMFQPVCLISAPNWVTAKS